LSQLLDVKAQKVAAIVEELTKLKVEKDRVLASIKKRSKSLEATIESIMPCCLIQANLMWVNVP
jgi:hypothetical protein